MSNSDLGTLDQRIMAAIIGQHPRAYGVSIRQFIGDEFGRLYSIGGIYAALERLEHEGLVVAKTGEKTAERGGRAKSYYTITGKGRSAFNNALSAIDALRAKLGPAEVAT